MPVQATRKNVVDADGDLVRDIFAERDDAGVWHVRVGDPFPGPPNQWRVATDDATVDTILNAAYDRRAQAVSDIASTVGAFRDVVRNNGGTPVT